MRHEGQDARHGTVFIAWDDYFKKYLGYWDSLPDAPSSNLAQLPETDSQAAALAWARERARRVIIRPQSDPHHQYWAGVGEPTRPMLKLPMSD
jgi:hypothetical protein